VLRSARYVRAAVIALIGVLALVGAGLTLASDEPEPQVAAQSATLVLPPSTELNVVARPTPPMPPYLFGIAHPVFGSTVTRISDLEAFGAERGPLRHTSHKVQAWNSDGSRLLLGYTDPGYLLDGRSYVYDGQRMPRSSVGVWSNVDPDVFYSVEGNKLLRISAANGEVSVLRTFDGWSTISIGYGQGSPSDDDRSLVLIADAPGRQAVLVHDLVADETVGLLEIAENPANPLKWAAVSQSGEHVVLQWDLPGDQPGSGVDLFDRTLAFERHLFAESSTADMGYDTSGNEVYVTLDPPTGKADGDRLPVVMVDLVDGTTTEVLSTDWVGTHLSCRNLDRPGWCFLSDSQVDAPRARTGGFDEVYAVRLDGSGIVNRFAHAQQSPGVPSDTTTRALPSRDGTRVLWASDWRAGPSGPALAYVASFSQATGQRG